MINIYNAREHGTVFRPLIISPLFLPCIIFERPTGLEPVFLPYLGNVLPIILRCYCVIDSVYRGVTSPMRFLGAILQRLFVYKNLFNL